MKRIQFTFAIVTLLLMGWSCQNTITKQKKADTKKEQDSIVESKSIDNDSLVENSNEYAEDIIDNWLKLGTAQAKVLEKLGEPDFKDEDIEWGALGTYVQEWKYTSKGLSLQMESGEKGGKKDVLMITLTNSSYGKTSKMVSVGASEEEVKQAYPNFNRDFSSEKGVVIGSIYGGVIYSLKNGKVNRIFIGAAAE